MATARAVVAAEGGNADDACFVSETYRASPTAERVFHPECAPALAGAPPRYSEFVFWDDIHPTGAAHALLGEALRAHF
jgi:phospholipase/lecithinase/hemolysin